MAYIAHQTRHAGWCTCLYARHPSLEYSLPRAPQHWDHPTVVSKCSLTVTITSGWSHLLHHGRSFRIGTLTLSVSQVLNHQRVQTQLFAIVASECLRRCAVCDSWFGYYSSPQCVRPYEVDGYQSSNPELDGQTDTRKRIRVMQVGSR